MDTFQNSIIKGIHKSRYVASWVKQGGSLTRKESYKFQEWLETIRFDGSVRLSQDEIQEIYNYATNGKLELEILAAAYLNQH